jgi:hypothetical protein
MEYIIGDSAFSPSQRMIRKYKKPSGQVCLIAENEFFNTKLTSAGIKSELIKNRFPFHHALNINIKKAQDV